MSEEEFSTETDMGDSPGQGEGSVTLSRRERRQLQREERRAQREIEQTTEIEETEVEQDNFGEEEFDEEEIPEQTLRLVRLQFHAMHGL